jgi:hypothetical protein
MSNPFTEAREKRGWSIFGAACRMRGVSEQQLRNLEQRGATRPTDPAHVRVKTACEIIRVYWPDVQLTDFVPDTDLCAKPANRMALRRLKGYSS